MVKSKYWKGKIRWIGGLLGSLFGFYPLLSYFSKTVPVCDPIRPDQCIAYAQKIFPFFSILIL